MSNPRVIDSETLFNIMQNSLLANDVDDQWWLYLEPNSVNVVDHVVKTSRGFFCKILCRLRDSDEAHQFFVNMTHPQFESLPTADEFAAQLQRESEIDETN